MLVHRRRHNQPMVVHMLALAAALGSLLGVVESFSVHPSVALHRDFQHHYQSSTKDTDTTDAATAELLFNAEQHEDEEEDLDLEDFVDDLMRELEAEDFEERMGVDDVNNDEDDDDNIDRDNHDTSNLHPEELSSSVDDLTKFVTMVERTPVGSLDKDELVLLRETIAEITNKDDIDETDAEAAEDLLHRIVREWRFATYEGTDDDSKEIAVVEPRDEDFLLVLQAWEAAVMVESDNGEQQLNTNVLAQAVDRTYQLFHLQRDLANSNDQAGLEAIEPSVETLETVLRILSLSRDKGADRRVSDVFKQIHDKTANMYASVIQSVAKSRDRGAANRAERLVLEAVDKFPPALVDGKQVGLTIDSFNVVLTAWAKSGLHYGPERAEKLLVIMDETDTENGSLGLIKPNIFSFTSLIDAYTQQGDWDGARQGERILKRLLDQYLNGEEGIPEPSVASWDIVISAWSRLSKKGYRGAAGRAGRLLELMEKHYDEGKIGFGPDSIVYISCMNAYAHSKTTEGPAKAEELLDLMNEFYVNGDETMKPSVKSVRVVVDAWIRSNATDAMDEAELVLERYEDLLDSLGPPNEPLEVLFEVRDIYRTMLFGWAKMGFPEQAQQYLEIMIDKGMKPDCFCYDRVIESYTIAMKKNDDDGSDGNDNQEAFAKSYQVFEWMESRRKLGEVNPNERVYTSFIRSMTKARIPNLAHKANVMLKRMDDLYAQGNKGIRPTVFSYNAVLMACAESVATPDPSPTEAFRTAVQIFNAVRTGEEEPDHVTFGNMLRCTNLLPDGDQKDGVIKSTFSLCCKAGFVNDFVVRDLQLAASEPLWRSLLGAPAGDAVNVELLPRAWRYRFEKRKQQPPPAMRKPFARHRR